MTTQRDSTAIATAKAETLISSKLYPMKAAVKVPAGYSIVSTNSKNVKTDIAFFIQRTLLFPQHPGISVREDFGGSAKYDRQQNTDSVIK